MGIQKNFHFLFSYYDNDSFIYLLRCFFYFLKNRALAHLWINFKSPYLLFVFRHVDEIQDILQVEANIMVGIGLQRLLRFLLWRSPFRLSIRQMMFKFQLMMWAQIMLHLVFLLHQCFRTPLFGFGQFREFNLRVRLGKYVIGFSNQSEASNLISINYSSLPGSNGLTSAQI